MDGLASAIPTFGAPTLDGIEMNGVPAEGQRLGGSSKRQYVRFYKRRIAQPYAAEVDVNPRTGSVVVKKVGIREIEREFVHVKTPGDTNEVDDVAEDYHRRQYWTHYRQFRDGKGAPIGQPIDDCTYVSSEVATELKYLGVYTEEQLADAADMLCDQVPNGYDIREFARANCKVRSDNAASGQVNLLRAEMYKMQETIKALTEQLSTKGEIVDATGEVVTHEPKRVGRPKKINLEA